MDATKQSNMDSFISSQYSQGITNPSDILEKLKEGGDTTTTLKDITSSLQNIIPAGVDDMVKTASQNGAPPEVIQKILQSPDLATAYKNAGNFMMGGTGTTGLYNYYLSKGGTKTIDEFLKATGEFKTPAVAKSSSSVGSIFGGTSASGSDVQLIAQAIIDGNQPPVVTGLYGNTAAVRAELQRQGFDYTKANQDWTATQKLLATMNGAQQTRLRQAINQVPDLLESAKSLADEWDSMGLPGLSKANLALAKSGAKGQEAQSLAVRLDAQIADVVSDLATVYKGGNSSTDESLKLASSQLSSNWGRKAFDDAVEMAKNNVKIRQNSLNLTTAGINDSNYNKMPVVDNLVQDEKSSDDPLGLGTGGNTQNNNPLGI